jgi:DNA polymerase-3 subunit delta'
VVIVDTADDLNRNAANALLKALEEPPPRAVFVLVAHRPARLIPTIRSRCARIDLAALGDADMAAALVGTGVLEAADVAAVAQLSPGRPGEALRLNAEGARALGKSLAGLVAALPELDLEALHKLADAHAGPRADAQFRLLMELIAEWLEGTVRAGLGGSPARTALVPAAPPLGAGASALEPYLALWEKVVLDTRTALELNLDRKLLILNTFFAMATAARRSLAA